MNGFKHLRQVVAKLDFQPHNIKRFLDERGRYDVDLAQDFPLYISLFRFKAHHFTSGPTWHERLELFLTLDDLGPFKMGEQTLNLKAGDLVVVDNMQVHHVLDHPDLDSRVIVVSFLPELVCNLGSAPDDYAYLVPFLSSTSETKRILSYHEQEASGVYSAIARLLQIHFNERERPYWRAGCKASLLELLFQLARHFHQNEIMRSEFLRQQERSQKFTRLLEFVSQHYPEKIGIQKAAEMCALSQSRFVKLFRQTTGTTFVNYLNHVRLSKAHQLLRETNFSIAEIAHLVGFSDQSYFDRRFKEYFQQTPRDFRKSL